MINEVMAEMLFTIIQEEIHCTHDDRSEFVLNLIDSQSSGKLFEYKFSCRELGPNAKLSIGEKYLDLKPDSVISNMADGAKGMATIRIKSRIESFLNSQGIETKEKDA